MRGPQLRLQPGGQRATASGFGGALVLNPKRLWLSFWFPLTPAKNEFPEEIKRLAHPHGCPLRLPLRNIDAFIKDNQWSAENDTNPPQLEGTRLGGGALLLGVWNNLAPKLPSLVKNRAFVALAILLCRLSKTTWACNMFTPPLLQSVQTHPSTQGTSSANASTSTRNRARAMALGMLRLSVRSARSVIPTDTIRVGCVFLEGPPLFGGLKGQPKGYPRGHVLCASAFLKERRASLLPRFMDGTTGMTTRPTTYHGFYPSLRPHGSSLVAWGSQVASQPAVTGNCMSPISRKRRSTLGVNSPFFPGILLSRKPPKTLGKWLAFEKNDG